MSSMVVLQGEVEVTAIEAWRRLEGGYHPSVLPALLAQALGDEAELITVQDALEACEEQQEQLGEGPFFLDVAVEGDRLIIDGLLVEDDYREVGRHVLALVAAAGQAGGSGRLQVRDAGAFEGGAITLRDGAIAFETFSTDAGDMSAADRRGFDAVMARSGHDAPPPAQAKPARARATPKGKAKPAQKTQAKAKQPVAKKPVKKTPAKAKRPVLKQPAKKTKAKPPARQGRRR